MASSLPSMDTQMDELVREAPDLRGNASCPPRLPVATQAFQCPSEGTGLGSPHSFQGQLQLQMWGCGPSLLAWLLLLSPGLPGLRGRVEEEARWKKGSTGASVGSSLDVWPQSRTNRVHTCLCPPPAAPAPRVWWMGGG